MTSCLDNCHKLLLLLFVGYHITKVMCSKFITHYDPLPLCCLKSFKDFFYTIYKFPHTWLFSSLPSGPPTTAAWLTVLWPYHLSSNASPGYGPSYLGLSLFYLPEILFPPLFVKQTHINLRSQFPSSRKTSLIFLQQKPIICLIAFYTLEFYLFLTT